MKSFRLLSKKSLSFALLVLFVGSQSLVAENLSDGNDATPQNDNGIFQAGLKEGHQKGVDQDAKERLGLERKIISLSGLLMNQENKNIKLQAEIEAQNIIHQAEMKAQNTIHQALKKNIKRIKKNNKGNMEFAEREYKGALDEKNQVFELDRLKLPSFSSSCSNKDGVAGIVFVAVLAGAFIHYLYQKTQRKTEKKATLKTGKIGLKESN